MKKSYYLFNPGRLSRKNHTIQFMPVPGDDPSPAPRYLPVEGISAMYVFGSVDANSAFFNFLGRNHIPVHFFDYHEHYTGSFSPREYLLAGQVLISQADAYRSAKKRLHIAHALVDAAVFNMMKNLRYYANRGRDLTEPLRQLDALRSSLDTTSSVPELMGLEGNCRQIYYTSFEEIIDGFAWEGRRKRPPQNELNALVSFGNALCYTICLDAIYNTQLNPTISFLHEPGVRRYSLALDLAEIFKPVLVDRLIFRMCNRNEIRDEHFDLVDDACFLSERGRKVFVKAWEERLNKTIQHRTLNKTVSYRHLIRLDCYKLAKYIMAIDESYEPFKGWW